MALALGAAGVLLTPLRVRLLKADPSYYLSYALDYGDVAARYGQTYHGNRVAYLLVERAGFALLGPETGYLVVRWLLLAVATAAVLALVAPRVGPVVAVGLGAAVALTPWLPRQLLWTHYDGVAAVYLMLVAWLLLGDARHRWRQVAAGALLGLVVNTNLAFGVLAAAAVLAWLVAVPLPGLERLRGVLRMAGGAAGALLVLSLSVRLLVGSGPWFSEWIAIRTALVLAGDATWFTPLGAAVAQNPMLALIPVIGAAAVAAARRPAAAAARPDAALPGGVWLLAASGAILVLHVAASSGWLGAPFYVIALLPPTVVAVTGLAERLAPGSDAPRWSAPTVVATVLWTVGLVVLWRAARLQPWALAVACGALAVVAAAVLVRPSPSVVLRRAAVLLVPMVLLATWSAPAQVPGTDGFPDLAARETKEWTLFRAIVGVKALVAASVPPDRDLTFWHRVDGAEGAWLREVNMAYYGGGTGRLHADKGDDPFGMPELRGEQVVALRERAPVSVVLLGLDRAELTAGLVALATAVPDGRVVAQEVLPGAAFDLHVAVVAIE